MSRSTKKQFRSQPLPEITGMQHLNAHADCPLCGVWGIPWVDDDPQTWNKQHVDADALWQQWDGRKDAAARVVAAAAELGVVCTQQQASDHFRHHRVEQPTPSGMLNREDVLLNAQQLSDRHLLLLETIYRVRFLDAQQIRSLLYHHVPLNSAKVMVSRDIQRLCQQHLLYRYFREDQAAGGRGLSSSGILYFTGRNAIPILERRLGWKVRRDHYVLRRNDVRPFTLRHDNRSNNLVVQLQQQLRQHPIPWGDKEVFGQLMLANWYGPKHCTLAYRAPGLVDAGATLLLCTKNGQDIQDRATLLDRLAQRQTEGEEENKQEQTRQGKVAAATLTRKKTTLAVLEPVEKSLYADGFAAMSVPQQWLHLPQAKPVTLPTMLEPTEPRLSPGDDLPSLLLPFMYEYDMGSKKVFDVAEQLLSYQWAGATKAVEHRFPDLLIPGYRCPIIMIFDDSKGRIRSVENRIKKIQEGCQRTFRLVQGPVKGLGLPVQTADGWQDSPMVPIICMTYTQWMEDPWAQDGVRLLWDRQDRTWPLFDVLLRCQQPILQQPALIQQLHAATTLRVDLSAARPEVYGSYGENTQAGQRVAGLTPEERAAIEKKALQARQQQAQDTPPEIPVIL